MLKIVTCPVETDAFTNNLTSPNQSNSLIQVPKNSVSRAIALGNFDGIHQGHQKVIEPIFKIASSPLVCPSLVTFVPHPQEFFSGEKKLLLTPIEEKSILLEKMGIRELVLLPFDRELASLTPQDFVLKVLIKKLNASFLSIGEDFRFGYQRQGNANDLQSIAIQENIPVNITREENIKQITQQKRISSSYIRECLEVGKIELANQMLGREYQIIGKVTTGQKLGRTIGFPTANLVIPPEKFVPKKGVYGVKVVLKGNENTEITGVMNIGNRPTVNGQNLTIEVHLLNWQGNLYEQTIFVKLVKFIRPEQKFNSLMDLKQQIQEDCRATQQAL